MTDISKLKYIIRTLTGINIVFIFLFVGYIVVLFETDVRTEIQDSTNGSADRLWRVLIMIIVWLVTMIFCILMVTMDITLFQKSESWHKSLRKGKWWLRVSTVFMVHSILSFLVTIVNPGLGNAYVTLVLSVGGVVLRMVTAHFVLRYIGRIKLHIEHIHDPEYPMEVLDNTPHMGDMSLPSYWEPPASA